MNMSRTKEELNLLLDEDGFLPESGFTIIYSFDELHYLGYKVFNIDGYNRVLNKFLNNEYVRIIPHFGCIVGKDDFVNLANVINYK